VGFVVKVLKCDIVKVLTLVVLIPSLLIGSRYGLIGVVFGHQIATLVERVVGLMIASHFVKIAFSEIFGELKPALLGVKENMMRLVQMFTARKK
jgi:hypothetical protein